MDEIYFWVLRVWRALTSGPKAIIALVGVAAIVVTVTTVFAAPSEDGQDAVPEVTSEVPEDAVPIAETQEPEAESGAVAGETYVYVPLRDIDWWCERPRHFAFVSFLLPQDVWA